MKEDYQEYLIDLDGAIHLGKGPIPAGKRFVKQLQGKDLPFLFITNNTTKSPETVAQRLANEFDIHVPTSLVYTVTLAAIDYVKETNRGKKVFTTDKTDLIDLILEADFKWDKANPNYVIVGLGTELPYEKVVLATLVVQRRALSIGTNLDKNIPTKKDLLPDAGPAVTSVGTAAQAKPVYISEPKAIVMERAIAHLGVGKEQVIMVGDSYEADVQSRIQNGIDSLSVTSGFTPKSAVPTLPVPSTYIVDSLDKWIF